MKRRPLLHVINFLLPILFFLSLDLSSFFISDHRSEKLGFKVTILLAISVLLLILNEILPAMSNETPLIGSYPILDSNVVPSLLLIPAECLSRLPHSHLQYRDLWTDVAESSWNHTGHVPPGQRSNLAEGTLVQGAGGDQHWPADGRWASMAGSPSDRCSLQPFNVPLISEKAKKTLCWCICNAYESEKQGDVLVEAEEVKSRSHHECMPILSSGLFRYCR